VFYLNTLASVATLFGDCANHLPLCVPENEYILSDLSGVLRCRFACNVM